MKVLGLKYKFIFAALIAAVKRDEIQHKIGKTFTFKSIFPLTAGNVLLELSAEPKVDQEVEAAVEGEADMADQHQEVEPVGRWLGTV